MMALTSLEETFKELLKATGERLKPLGFVKRANVFRLLLAGNCGLIEFQRSVSNSSEILKFTVNLGVVCGELLDRGPSGIQNSRMTDAHLSERIGFLLPQRNDKWWEMTGSTDRALLVEEVVRLLVEEGVPYVRRHIDTKALMALWESGQSPGITSRERFRLLSKLKLSAGGPGSTIHK
jgi:hypothetical protein